MTSAPLTAEVVICAYDDRRWELLCAAVGSAQTQTVRPCRVFVCIDHNDALYERCLHHWPPGRDAAVPVTVLRNRFAGRLGSARNTALEQVESDVVAFLDDDAVAEPTWLEHLLRVYAETDAQAVGGAPHPVFLGHRPGWFPSEFDWVFGCHYAGLPEDRAPTRHLIGASMSARTSALRGLGGFHSDNHDDMDLSHRIAAAYGTVSVQYEPRAQVRHVVQAERLTWAYFWRRCFWVNRGKVRAFADMGEAGDLEAELRFARRMLHAVLARLARAVRGDGGALAQAAVIVTGLGLAAAGHVAGAAEHRLGRGPEPLTRGLPGPAGG